MNAGLVAQSINPIEKRKKDNIETEIESRDIAWLTDYFYKKYILTAYPQIAVLSKVPFAE